MKILYNIPSLDTITAGRPYYFGYKNAYEDMGHEFKALTSDSDPIKTFEEYNPDIFMNSINGYILKYLDLDAIKRQKEKGMRVFVNTPFWKSPMSKLRVNETPSLSDIPEYVSLIKSGKFGDYYYNISEEGDPRMDGFEKETGYKPHTLLLAADKTLPNQVYDEKYKADISFIGSYLPGRRPFMKESVFPLKKKYNLRLYMNDLTLKDQALTFALKAGQYFNIPFLKSFKKNNVTLEQEKKIFVSSKICINFHEDYQREFGNDFNDRTFKIPLSGGFQVCDYVKCIGKYLEDGKEIIMAKDTKDWFDKIDYYIKNPEKRLPVIEAGRQRVLKEHTYHNRIDTILSAYKDIK
jgi:hypothetical protein